jgi:pimeloyl-ACP methyl ester carboxylesterase
MVHGLCVGRRQWNRLGHDHGAALGRDLGYTVLYLDYNSGLHVSANGRALAEQLEALVAEWPVPVEELSILGHSMGGLVARSACAHAEQSGHAWLRRLDKLVFLGTPHHGAPLERGGHWLDFVMELSPYSAPFTQIGRARSAGITDLRHGTIAPGPHRVVPLPRGVKCYAAAAALGMRGGPLADRLVGDGLVPVDSALGKHPDRSRSLAIASRRQWIGYGMGHLELLGRAEVYAQLHEWLRDDG